MLTFAAPTAFGVLFLKTLFIIACVAAALFVISADASF